jgi:cystathionine beta-lyase family protein involved in aluminum resistance
VRRIDELKIVDFDAVLTGNFFDLGGRADQDRLYDAEFRRFDWAAKRTFIAGVHDDRSRCCHLLRPGDQMLVFRFWWMGRGSDGLKRAYFTLSFSWHAGSIRVNWHYDALDVVPVAEGDGFLTTVSRSSFPNIRLIRCKRSRSSPESSPRALSTWFTSSSAFCRVSGSGGSIDGIAERAPSVSSNSM